MRSEHRFEACAPSGRRNRQPGRHRGPDRIPGRSPTKRTVGILAALIISLAAVAVQAADSRVVPRGRDVTIIEGEDRTVYEYRQNGELRMIRIVPTTGRPYYLVPADDTQGYGNLEKADMLIPKWILVEF